MYGSIFIQICAVGSKRRIFSAPESVLAVQGRSGTSKVDDFGTNRKHVHDFLHDHGPILHRFKDMVTYWLKMAYFCYIFAVPEADNEVCADLVRPKRLTGTQLHFCYPSLIRRPRSLCSPRNFALKLTVRKLESWGYPPVKTA